MNITSRIHIKIEKAEQKLKVIESSIEEELRKPWQIRRKALLDFLYKEKVMYQFLLNELKAVIETGLMDENV